VSMDFTVEQLAATHLLDKFDSGQPYLDLWLREFASHTDRKNLGRTFVWHAGDNEVLGYYTLAPTVIDREELPARLGHGNPNRIPAVLLARLALDQRLHGQGLGEQLLISALERIVRAATQVGGRFVVVDAIDEAAVAFYCHYGFRLCPISGRRLVRKMSDIAAALNGQEMR
jgi:GNAT superfamily N-acetyltransferase